MNFASSRRQESGRHNLRMVGHRQSRVMTKSSVRRLRMHCFGGVDDILSWLMEPALK